MKNALILLVALLLAAGLGQGLLKLPGVQTFLLEQGSIATAKSAAEGFVGTDGLQVFVCGSASPIGVDQAQACIAVVTPEHFFLIDSGAGSTNNITRLALPIDRLQGLLITHFHSDHIAEIYEVNLNSWVLGRPAPLTVYGPRGIDEVVNAFNAGYRLDRLYRTRHHGLDLLPPSLGILKHKTIAPGVIFEDAGLKITAYVADHPPVEPAVGYRFDYNGRSVVISGDSNVTSDTREIVQGADLLLHDALSQPTMLALAEAMRAAGQTRPSKVLSDVTSYHASTDSLIELSKAADVDLVAFYHLVPTSADSLLMDIFKRGMPDNFLLAEDLMWFDLPLDSSEIVVNRP